MLEAEGNVQRRHRRAARPPLSDSETKRRISVALVAATYVAAYILLFLPTAMLALWTAAAADHAGWGNIPSERALQADEMVPLVVGGVSYLLVLTLACVGAALLGRRGGLNAAVVAGGGAAALLLATVATGLLMSR